VRRPARRRAVDRLPERGALRRRARHALDREQVFADRPATGSPTRCAGKRVGVYGLDYVMTVRDYARSTAAELVPFDVEFDLARAVKSDAELESVRDSVRINTEGFWAFLDAYAPGKSAAEVLAPPSDCSWRRAAAG
jgi:Xaa-Pro aminopeptidase